MRLRVYIYICVYTLLRARCVASFVCLGLLHRLCCVYTRVYKVIVSGKGEDDVFFGGCGYCIDVLGLIELLCESLSIYIYITLEFNYNIKKRY